MTREQMLRERIETCDREMLLVDIAIKQLFDRIIKNDLCGRPYIDVEFRVLPDVKGALTNGST